MSVIVIEPEPITLSLEVVPVVAITQGPAVQPEPVQINLNIQDPSVTTGTTITPDPVLLTLVIPQPRQHGGKRTKSREVFFGWFE